MRIRTGILLICAAAVFTMRLSAQSQGVASGCTVDYENHNQIDYGPLIVQEVKGVITDPELHAMPRVCVGLFTESDHKLIASMEADAEGRFSLRNPPPGRYRLVVRAEGLCAANVPLTMAKRQRRKQVLHVHMKPRGLDTCSYAEFEKSP